MRFSPYAWGPKDIVGGNAALDFVNTASGWATGDPVDHLGGAEGFVDWTILAGLLDDHSAALAREEIAGDPKTAAARFQEARELRAALRRIFSAVAAEEPAADSDLAILSAWKARTAFCCELVQENGAFRRRCSDGVPAAERPLRLIVEAAEDLLLNGPLDRLHVCGGDNCEWMFVDLSKNGRRRWCSMATCGNDAKVKKFRRRKKEAA